MASPAARRTGSPGRRAVPAPSLEAALRQSEQLTRGIIDSLAAHVAVLDPSGRIVMTNEAWNRFARENSGGRPRKTGAGVNYLNICRSACGGESAEGAEEVLDGLTRLLAGGQERFHYEYPCHSPSERRWFLLQATRLRGAAGGAVLLHIDITERKLMEGKLLDHERLRVLTTGLLKGQEEERRRIARELHDGLNQQVAVLAIELGMFAQQAQAGGNPLSDELRKLQKQAIDLSDQIRRVSHRLHPSALEHLGIVVALKSHCAEFSRLEGIRAGITAQGDFGDLSLDRALCLYRVAQECLANAARHSGAREVLVSLSRGGGNADLVVIDNGHGFDPSRRGKGLGLVSMEERVNLLGGCFEIRSEPGEGTRVHIRLPLQEVPG
jgi:signal transduction histidine kinase